MPRLHVDLFHRAVDGTCQSDGQHWLALAKGRPTDAQLFELCGKHLHLTAHGLQLRLRAVIVFAGSYAFVQHHGLSVKLLFQVSLSVQCREIIRLKVYQIRMRQIGHHHSFGHRLPFMNQYLFDVTAHLRGYGCLTLGVNGQLSIDVHTADEHRVGDVPHLDA